MLKILLLREISENLMDQQNHKDKQISRLSKNGVGRVTLMDMIDDIIDLPLYRPYTQNFRDNNISLLGLGRKEQIELVKAISSNDSYYDTGEAQEKRGIWNRIKNRFAV